MPEAVVCIEISDGGSALRKAQPRRTIDPATEQHFEVVGHQDHPVGINPTAGSFNDRPGYRNRRGVIRTRSPQQLANQPREGGYLESYTLLGMRHLYIRELCPGIHVCGGVQRR